MHDKYILGINKTFRLILNFTLTITRGVSKNIIGEYIAQYFKTLQYCNILFFKIKKYIIIIAEDIAI